jgi:hypothetical protein
MMDFNSEWELSEEPQEEVVQEEPIEEVKEVKKVKEMPKPKKASKKKVDIKGSIFVLTNEGLMQRLKNRGMRLSEVYENVKFEADNLGNAGGSLVFDIAFALVKRGGYLIIKEDLLVKLMVSTYGYEVEKGWAYIKK